MKLPRLASWAAFSAMVCAAPAASRAEVLAAAAGPAQNLSNGTTANVPAFATSAVAPEPMGSTAEADGISAVAPGMTQAQVHACDSSSETILGADADGSGNTSFADTISVSSTTLTLGTMVPVEFKAVLAFQPQVLAEAPIGLDDFAAVSANLSFSYASGSAIFGSYSNGKGFEDEQGDPVSSGMYSDTTFDTIMQVAVGSTIPYNYSFSAGSECGINGLGSPYVDGDLSEALLYGYGSSNPAVTLTPSSGSALPDLSAVTMSNATSNLIPDPFDVPEPDSSALLLAVAAFLLTQRRRSSVVCQSVGIH